MKREIKEVIDVTTKVFSKYGFKGEVTIYGDYINKERITDSSVLCLAYPIVSFHNMLEDSVLAEDEISKILGVKTEMSDTSCMNDESNPIKKIQGTWLKRVIKGGYTFEIR